MKALELAITDSNTQAVDSRALRAFVAVAHEGNVSRAAVRLCLSQPAVSLQLKKLEDSIGLQLFARLSTGLVLTRDGAALLPQAERTLAALMEFSQATLRMKGRVRGKLRIGTILDPEFTRLGAFLHELVTRTPEAEPELRQGISGMTMTQLARGELDVGYYLGDPASEPEWLTAGPSPVSSLAFHSQVLTRFTYRVVGPAGWESQLRGRDWPALAKLPWIGTPPESVHHRLLARIFGGQGVQPTRVALVDQESSMLALVRAGVGLSLARDSLAIRESQAHGIVIADAVAIESLLTFVCLKSRRHEPLVQRAFAANERAWGEAARSHR